MEDLEVESDRLQGMHQADCHIFSNWGAHTHLAKEQEG